MLARAAIVLLVVLNLGAAAWWGLRGDALGVPAPAWPAAGAPLKLLREVPCKAPPRPPAVRGLPAAGAGGNALAALAPQAPAAALQCHALGPFDDAARSASARLRLQPHVTRLQLRSTPVAAARGWRVWIPPLPDQPSAQALLARIAAAGFDDFFIVVEGADANGIALGRYRSEAAAQRRAERLRAGGFDDVRAEALGMRRPQIWIDVAAPLAFQAASAHRALGVAPAQSIDCATVL